jgi:uncharacterized protein
VKGFLDPAVQFGLQFETANAERRPREVEAAKAEAKPAPAKAEAETTPPDLTPAEAPAQDEAAKVVSLDQFRKK